MKNYGTQKSTVKPEDIVVDEYSVWVYSDIKEVLENIGNENEFVGYEFTMIQYTLDEYIQIQAERNTELETQVTNTQLALVELYEDTEICKPNLLINGNFDIWQRGESFSGPSSNGIYRICDMFSVAQEGGAIINTNRIKDNNPENSHILLDFTTAGTTSSFRYYFEPEIYKKFSNKMYTFAIDCEASEDVSIMIAPNSMGNIWDNSQHSKITTKRKTIIVHIQFEDLSEGNKVGHMQLIRILSPTFKGKIKIYRVKMEEGDRFTGFKSTTDYGDELRKCQYYLQVFSGTSVMGFGVVRLLSTTDTVLFTLKLLNSMRINVPSLKYTNSNMMISTYSYNQKSVTKLSLLDNICKAREGILTLYIDVENITNMTLDDIVRFQFLSEDDRLYLSAEV